MPLGQLAQHHDRLVHQLGVGRVGRCPDHPLLAGLSPHNRFLTDDDVYFGRGQTILLKRDPRPAHGHLSGNYSTRSEQRLAVDGGLELLGRFCVIGLVE